MTRTLSHSLCVCALPLSRYFSLTHSLSLSLEVTYLRKPLAQPPGQHTPVRHLCECMCMCVWVCCLLCLLFFFFSSSSAWSTTNRIAYVPVWVSFTTHLRYIIHYSTHTIYEYTTRYNINKQLDILAIIEIICLSFSLFNVFLLGAAAEVGSLPFWQRQATAIDWRARSVNAFWSKSKVCEVQNEKERALDVSVCVCVWESE